jgi:hypothetical protein
VGEIKSAMFESINDMKCALILQRVYFQMCTFQPEIESWREIVDKIPSGDDNELEMIVQSPPPLFPIVG